MERRGPISDSLTWRGGIIISGIHQKFDKLLTKQRGQFSSKGFYIQCHSGIQAVFFWIFMSFISL
jgi:hypothetical protein